METTKGNNQFGHGSKFDESKNQDSRNEGIITNAAQEETKNPETSDDDFLSGDNAKKMYPNNQNNHSSAYNERAVTSVHNPNIGGDESEYETSTSDANSYKEESLADNNDGFADRKDSEEINNHDEPTRYSNPTSRNTSEE